MPPCSTTMSLWHSLFLVSIFFISLAVARARPQGHVNNLITITTAKKTSTPSSAQILISSPSEHYHYQQNPLVQRSAPLAGQFASALKSAESAIDQQMPLYRDEGPLSTSNQYHTAEGSSAGYNSGYPANFGSTKSSPRYNSASQNYNSGSHGYDANPIRAAVMSHHKISYYDVESSPPVKPTTIEVAAGHLPLNILFRSSSSHLNVQQVHDGAKGTSQETESIDEPHLLKHTVTKPIYQQLFEMITPYRYIKQELHPVQEQIETIVARENSKEYGKTDYSEYSGGASGYQADHPIVHTPPISQVVQQTPEYQSSSQVATITKVTQHPKNTYQPLDLEPEEVAMVKANTAEHQQLIDQIGRDFMTSSSNALLSSVYGVSAATSPTANMRLLPQHLNHQYTPIDADLVNQYLPLVYEVMNTMEDNHLDADTPATSGSLANNSTK